MPTPAERRAARLRADATRMNEAAGKIREMRGTGFATLDEDEADALAALIDTIAGTATDRSSWRTWEAARRTAQAILAPARPPASDWGAVNIPPAHDARNSHPPRS